jgi:hypothetical protein
MGERTLSPQQTLVFEYLYRDAGNYKAFGAGLVRVGGGEDAEARIRAALGAEGTFVAEQCGIPPLYGGLWELSGGPTADDHALHEFVRLRPADDEDRALPELGSLAALVARLRLSALAPDYRLSPHGGLVG